MGSKYNNGGIFANSNNPGPGAHDPEFKRSQNRPASYSFKGKHKMGTQIVINTDGNHNKVTPSADMTLPGPGTYQPDFKQKETRLSAKFGHERRQSMGVKGAEKQPAPNAYRDCKNNVLKAAPSFGFGTSKRPATADARKNPGPGSYAHKSVMGTDT